jgi:hypothetical protein
MKLRNGFVSNSSSSSFVLNKDCMTEDDVDEFQKQREIADECDRFDRIGETDNFFFGIVDYSNKFCQWLEEKKFERIEWGG